MRAIIPQSVQDAADAVMKGSRMPGIIVALSRGDDDPSILVRGEDGAGRPLSANSLLPVASLTKLATSLALLRLVEDGRVSLDDPLARYLPEAASAQTGVSVRRLLSHSSGLPVDVAPELAPYRKGLNWQTLSRACLETPLERTPGSYVQYSNVGYGLLALIVEAKTGLTFSSALQSLVLDPLRMEGYLGSEPLRSPAYLAGVRGSSAKGELESFNSPFWRSLSMPWAGLVTDIQGAMRLLAAFAGRPGGLIKAETALEATRNQNGSLPGAFAPPMVWDRCPWGLGPELKGSKSPHWSPANASPDSFGHAGASGTFVWRDPSADVQWAIFGTRTADSGWLLRRGPALGEAILRSLS